MMKPVFLLLVILSLCFSACQKDRNFFTLNGDIRNLTNDTLYLFNEFEKDGRIDTLLAQDGKISCRIPLDTVTPFTLLVNGQVFCPVYADREQKLYVEGDADDVASFRVKGGMYNEDINRFKERLAEGGEASVLADEFIRQHPDSYACLYLLDTYFLRNDSADLRKVVELVKGMKGEVQDLFYLKQQNEVVRQYAERTQYISAFNLKDGEGKTISSSRYNGKLLLVHFWATWDAPSTEANLMFKRIYEKFRKNKRFAMIGISFDIDAKAFLEGCKSDTLQWDQAFETDGFDGKFARQFDVRRLPCNFLVSPRRTVIVSNATEKELISQIEKALEEEKELDKKQKNNAR